MNQSILISGCSGGGKSALLAELRRRGQWTVAEPGRRVVAEEKTGTGAALPWVNLEAFAHRALKMAHEDLRTAAHKIGFVFFDRGLIDAAVALQVATGVDIHETLGPEKHYATDVFLAPPWPENFKQDEDRRHGFDQAVAEYERLAIALRELGYSITLLPKTSIKNRADFVLERLEGQSRI